MEPHVQSILFWILITPRSYVPMAQTQGSATKVPDHPGVVEPEDLYKPELNSNFLRLN